MLRNRTEDNVVAQEDVREAFARTLSALNPRPELGIFACVGRTLKDQRCRRVVCQDGAEVFFNMIRRLDTIDIIDQETRFKYLQELAKHGLCKQNHRGKYEMKIAFDWTMTVVKCLRHHFPTDAVMEAL